MGTHRGVVMRRRATLAVFCLLRACQETEMCKHYKFLFDFGPQTTRPISLTVW